jgi:hypothetical protein
MPTEKYDYNEAEFFSAHAKAMKRIEYHKENMCPSSVRSACNPVLVDSHTISLSQLSLMTSRGKVMELVTPSLSKLEIEMREGTLNSDSLLVERKIGKRKAGTFSGFCAFHDSEFFKSIDSTEIVISRESIGLIMYRTICRKLFIKSTLNEIVDAAELLPFSTSPSRVMSPAYVREGNTYGEASLRNLKSQLDEMVLKREWSAIEYLALRFSDPIDFACADSDFPQVDFQGRVLQGDLSDNNINYDRIFFGMIPQAQGGVFYLASIGRNRSGEALIQSLRSLPLKPRRAIAALRYAFSFSDELFIRPEWWAGLSLKARKELRGRRMQNGFREHTSSDLIEGSDTIANYELAAIYES